MKKLTELEKRERAIEREVLVEARAIIKIAGGDPAKAEAIAVTVLAKRVARLEQREVSDE